jgi:hypothetical protein
MEEFLPTFYEGVRFRSLLVAQWACFLDTLLIRYQYRTQVTEAWPNLEHVPDFWLPEQQIWVDVTAIEPTESSGAEAVDLFEASGRAVYFFLGFPHVRTFADETQSGHRKEICDFGIFFVNASSPDRCVATQAATLTEMMLRLLGLVNQSSDDHDLASQIYRLVHAVEKSNEFFAIERRNQDLRD